VAFSRHYDKDYNDHSSRKERVDWNPHFEKVKGKHKGQNCGVMYCVLIALGNVIKKMCGDHTESNCSRFIFHKEYY